VACLTSSVGFVGSLSDYAKTLVPNLLNVEDVVLLRCLKPFYCILYCILVFPNDD
jgi:branched-subunit amino acid permease